MKSHKFHGIYECNFIPLRLIKLQLFPLEKEKLNKLHLKIKIKKNFDKILKNLLTKYI